MPQTLTLVQQRAAALSEADNLEARIWLAADALYHKDNPFAGRLIYADDAIRGTYVAKAVVATSMLTDPRSIIGAQRLAQAAADFAAHREWVMAHATLRYYHVTNKEQQ